MLKGFWTMFANASAHSTGLGPKNESAAAVGRGMRGVSPGIYYILRAASDIFSPDRPPLPSIRWRGMDSHAWVAAGRSFDGAAGSWEYS